VLDDVVLRTDVVSPTDIVCLTDVKYATNVMCATTESTDCILAFNVYMIFVNI